MPELIIQSAHMCGEALWGVETLTLSTKWTDSSIAEKLSTQFTSIISQVSKCSQDSKFVMKKNSSIVIFIKS